MKLYFVLRNETKGALRYEECNESSLEPKSINQGALIGTLYVRKSAVPNGAQPRALTIEVNFVE